ncbi:unnamed protein product [Candida verbasci]|uniref:Peroxin/Ferlin domain-containing protein n=1 Tax=Candida verbasci TaxID=1227364 RepID=A0A9W4XCL8_9ASCO|nr:unnamed protein product [Candida verbasci]
MPEFKNYLRATFEPSDTKLLSTSPTTKLLTESPVLATALSQIFPYLLLIDNFLEIISWTNDDQYLNFLIMVIYSCLIMYWNWFSHIILPLFFALAFASFVWSISSVIYDSEHDEKPTIEEILYTLHNLTVRSEMLFRPLKEVEFTSNNCTRFFIAGVILTPLQLLLTKTILTPQKGLWFFGLFIFSFHSPYSFAMRRLLWRSLYIRLAIVYMTGLNIKITKNDQVISPASSDIEDVTTLSNFKILKKKMVSPNQLKQTVLFEILQNERRWFGIGWSTLLYPHDKPNFCYEQNLEMAPSVTLHKDDFEFPTFENDIYTYSWEWLDDNWQIDLEFNKSKSKDGWVYYDNNWETPRYKDGSGKYTRSRKWIRKAVLIIDKHEIVYDE